MGNRRKLAALAAIGITGLGGLALQIGTSGASSSIARAELRDAGGNVVGEVVFKRQAGEIVGQAEVQLPAGGSEFRGFHIHANADGAGCVAPAFTSVGGHWDVGGHDHGAHTGDMPVLMGDAGGHARVGGRDREVRAERHHRARPSSSTCWPTATPTSTRGTCHPRARSVEVPTPPRRPTGTPAADMPAA